MHLRFFCLLSFFTGLFYSFVHFIIQPLAEVCLCYIRFFHMSWLRRNAKESSGLTTSASPTPPAGDPGPLAAWAPSTPGKRASEAAQGPPKPPRLTTVAASPAPSISPLSKRRRAGEARSPPALKVNIPTILVEDEPMEVDGGDEDGVEVRGCRSRPRSPVEGGGDLCLSCLLQLKNSKPRPPSYILFYFIS